MKTLAIKLFTVVFIFKNNKVLLLKRSLSKKFLPGKMVGIGGHIEPSETGDLLSSALREVEEETKLEKENLSNFKYLGVLSFSDYDEMEGHTYFFSAELNRDVKLDLSSPDGELGWYKVVEMPRLNFCEDTKTAIPYLLKAKRTGKIFRGNYIFNKPKDFFSYLFE